MNEHLTASTALEIKKGGFFFINAVKKTYCIFQRPIIERSMFHETEIQNTNIIIISKIHCLVNYCQFNFKYYLPYPSYITIRMHKLKKRTSW